VPGVLADVRATATPPSATAVEAPGRAKAPSLLWLRQQQSQMAGVAFCMASCRFMSCHFSIEPYWRVSAAIALCKARTPTIWSGCIQAHPWASTALLLLRVQSRATVM